MNARAAILLLTLPLAWSCTASGPPGQVAPRRDPNVITAEELQTANASNLFDAIRTLRPEWMQRGNPTTVRPQAEYSIVVFLDRIRFGDTESLRQLPVAMALEVRWYGRTEAQAEFGLGNLQGAIQVVTRRR